MKILKGPSTISSQCPIDLISFLLVQLNQMEPENDGDNSWFCLRAYKGGASTVQPLCPEEVFQSKHESHIVI